MAIKTFEQFSAAQENPVYTMEEYEAVYDIVSDYYDDDDIEDFIISPDVESKEEFIEENDIQNLRVCYSCGKFISEGYIYRDFETFCSKECFIDAYGKSIFDNADDDELYWTAWEG